MSNCLVTGADGFIGSHVCEALRDAGHDVTGAAWYNRELDYGWLDEVEGVQKVHCDIRDSEQIASLIYGNEYVFNLAALIDVAYSFRAERSYYETNSVGTWNVLNASYRAGAKLIQTSTSEVYGTAKYAPMDEKHPIHPQSPYAASKVAADAIVTAHYHTHGHESVPHPVILRPFNCFGPRQSERAVIPRIIKQALTQDTVKLGNLWPSRDYTYVTDTAKAFVKAMELPWGVYNVGTMQTHKIGDIAELICQKVGGGIRIDGDEVNQRGKLAEVDILHCDNTKMYQEGWFHEIPFDEGLEMTIEWWRDR